ncbi:MAG: iron-containing alcohol dehydrogenase [Hyphomicrobiales bacterium]
MSLITYVNKIHFADDVLEEALIAETDALSVSRPFVVTDSHAAETGLIERIQDALSPRTEAVFFSETPPSPTETACEQAAELYLSSQCDGIVAFGNGAAIDLAKAMSILATHDGVLSSYAAIEGGVERIKDILPPLIAIPTTAGTGSEVGRSAVITLSDGRKLGFISPYLLPNVAICDPTLTLEMTPELTAGTGMDALSHCVETYVATAYNPPADGIALDGLGRAAANIRRAVEDGNDLSARREMLAAAMNGALAFQKGLGGVHALSHALGSVADKELHHGTLNAILLPHVLEFNAPAVCERYGAMKRVMNLPQECNFADAIADLNVQLRLPSSLSELGITKQTIKRAAPIAEKDHANRTNPRRANAQDYHNIMEAAL